VTKLDKETRFGTEIVQEACHSNKAPSPEIGREGPSEGETLSCGWPLWALQSAAISRHELKDQPNLWHQTYNPSKVVTDSPTSLRRTVVHTTFMFLFRASCKLLLDPA
jgi:hypothetical protein